MGVQRTDVQTYKRMLQYVIPYKNKLIFSFVLLACASLFQAAISVVTYITINGLVNQEKVSFASFSNLPSYISSITFSTVWIPFILVGVFIFRGVFEYFSKYLMATTGLRALMDIRTDLYRHLAYLSADFYSGNRAGDLISRIMNDVNNINSAITTIVADCIKSPLTILWSIPMIFILGGKLAIISVCVFPLVIIPIALLGMKMRKLARRMMERSADITSFLQETFIGMRIVKAFAMEEREIQRFKEIAKSVFNYERKGVRVIEFQRPLIEIMGAVGIALTINYAMKELPVDRFMSFAASLFLLYEPFKKISKINITVQRAIASGHRIFDIMDQKPSIKELENSRVLMAETVSKITYEHVSFGYTDGTEVLHDFNIHVNKGDVTAFVGASGAGKTTVVNLLLRFYDPTNGRIMMDGVDIKEFSLSSLRSQIGLVTQEPILFNGTVADNIAYGKPAASMEEIMRAAKAANAHGFITTQLEKGYDTNIGERGMSLSGGQRQRLCIARAILKNPPILIFDEATSQLDSESEREVQGAIENLLHGRTVFMIAHRLSTVKNAHKIVVLDGGILIESGTHKELVEKDGAYKKFYDLQFAK